MTRGYTTPRWREPTRGTTPPGTTNTSTSAPSGGGGGSSSPGRTLVAPSGVSFASPSGQPADVGSIVDTSFGLANVSASLTNSKLYRTIAGATVVAAQMPMVTAYRGSVIAMSLSASENKTAGSAVFTAFVNDVATEASITWVDGTAKNQTSFRAGKYPFAVGDSIDVRVTTTSGYTPTTADVEILLYISQNLEAS